MIIRWHVVDKQQTKNITPTSTLSKQNKMSMRLYKSRGENVLNVLFEVVRIFIKIVRGDPFLNSERQITRAVI